MIPDLRPAEMARFYDSLHIGGCGVRWAGGDLNSGGYGRFPIYRDGKRVRILAHRLAYKLATGEDPGPAVVRHGCDTPLCCTPDCLKTGTQADNMRDAVERGRMNLTGLAAYRDDREIRFLARVEAQEKNCPDCKTVKPFSAFHRNRATSDGYATLCRPCAQLRDKSSGLTEDERAAERRRRMRRGEVAA